MAIAQGNIIKANDLFDKFTAELSSVLGEASVGISALVSALSGRTDTPISDFYINALTNISGNIVKLRALQDMQWGNTSTPRHMHAIDNITEASGRVIQKDFIAAYNFKSVLLSLYAIVSDLRYIIVELPSVNNISIENQRISFNDFALINTNEIDNSIISTHTAIAPHLTAKAYENINLLGRQSVFNLTDSNNGQTSKLKSNITLDNFYSTTPGDWNSHTSTGMVNQFLNLSGVTQIDDPLNNNMATLSSEIAEYFIPGTSDTEKIYSKTGNSSPQLATASTVCELMSKCYSLLNIIKEQLKGIYIGGNYNAIPTRNLSLISYPFVKNWFFSAHTGLAGATLNLSSFTGHEQYIMNNDITSSSKVRYYSPSKLILQNTVFSPAESWTIFGGEVRPLRVGYAKQNYITGEDNTIYTGNTATPANYKLKTYFCPMPLSYNDINTVNNNISGSSYIKILPSKIISGNTYILDKLVGDANNPLYHMPRVCVRYKTITTQDLHNINNYNIFIKTYKDFVRALNAGVLSSSKYEGQCVLSAYGSYDQTFNANNAEITANFPTLIHLAIAKTGIDGSGNYTSAIITSNEVGANLYKMPNYLGITITAWASLNEVNRSHGTSAYINFTAATVTGKSGINDIIASYTAYSKDAILAEYRWDRKKTDQTIVSNANKINDYVSLIVKHNIQADVKQPIEDCLFSIRDRFKYIYGDTDVLAQTGLAYANLQNVLAVGELNMFFRGCAGGSSVANFILKRRTGSSLPHRYGSGIDNSVPTISFTQYNSASSADGDGAISAVSQGYVGFEAFQFSHIPDQQLTNVTPSNISEIVENNGFKFVPLPVDIDIIDDISAVASPNSADLQYTITVKSNNWWNTCTSAKLLYNNSQTIYSSAHIVPDDNILGQYSLVFNIPDVITDDIKGHYVLRVYNNFGGFINTTLANAGIILPNITNFNVSCRVDEQDFYVLSIYSSAWKSPLKTIEILDNQNNEISAYEGSSVTSLFNSTTSCYENINTNITIANFDTIHTSYTLKITDTAERTATVTLDSCENVIDPVITGVTVSGAHNNGLYSIQINLNTWPVTLKQVQVIDDNNNVVQAFGETELSLAYSSAIKQYTITPDGLPISNYYNVISNCRLKLVDINNFSATVMLNSCNLPLNTPNIKSIAADVNPISKTGSTDVTCIVNSRHLIDITAITAHIADDQNTTFSWRDNDAVNSITAGNITSYNVQDNLRDHPFIFRYDANGCVSAGTTYAINITATDKDGRQTSSYMNLAVNQDWVVVGTEVFNRADVGGANKNSTLSSVSWEANDHKYVVEPSSTATATLIGNMSLKGGSTSVNTLGPPPGGKNIFITATLTAKYNGSNYTGTPDITIKHLTGSSPTSPHIDIIPKPNAASITRETNWNVLRTNNFTNIKMNFNSTDTLKANNGQVTFKLGSTSVSYKVTATKWRKSSS